MAKQPTSVRLPDLTINQLNQLIAATGMTQSELISTAIDRMYQQEIKTMNRYLITEEELGDEATKEQAERLISLLQQRGFDVEYGDPSMRRKPYDWDHNAEEDFNIAFLEEIQNV